MKKLAVLMGLVLVMALALPAAAGINTEITGKVGTQVYYDQHDGFWAFGNVETKVTMSTGTDGAIKAVVSLGATESKNDGKFGSPDTPFKKSEGINLAVNGAYIEANGAWLEGTPSVTSKIGRFGVNYNDWVANLGDRDAIELSNIDLGALDLAFAYAWANDPADIRITAIRGSGNLDVVELSGAYVVTSNLDTDASHGDFAISAKVAPTEGLSVGATFAGDGENNGSAYKVTADLDTIPGLKLGFSHWSTDAAFDPEYPKLDDGKPVAFPGNDKPNEKKGFEVTANTNQAGFDLGFKLKNTTDAAGGNEASSYEVTANRDFNGVKGSYKYESKDARHTITAETSVDTPIASGVNLKGTVRLQDGNDLEFGADATWKAPNGFNLGLHYANYDRGDSWGGRKIGPDGEADGFVVRAAYEISW